MRVWRNAANQCQRRSYGARCVAGCGIRFEHAFRSMPKEGAVMICRADMMRLASKLALHTTNQQTAQDIFDLCLAKGRAVAA